MSNTGIRRLKICELGPDSSCFFIVSIIIRKQEPREVTIKKDNFNHRTTSPIFDGAALDLLFTGRTNSSSKSVWCFTIRDAPSDYMNVNVWGSTDFVTNLYLHFQVGDVVDIIDPKISFRRVGDYDEKYHPSVTSSFCLTINEKRSEIFLHDSAECQEFLPLLHIPTKPLGNFFNLADIHSNSNILQGQYVNLLVAVSNVGDVRKVKSQNGKEYQTREVILIDQTTTTLTLHIWDVEISNMANTWVPRKTVLFIADTRIEWNKFRRSLMARVTSCTLITVNPATADAEKLRSYVLTAPIQPLAIIDNLAKFRNPYMITNIMSCDGILSKSLEKQVDVFTAALYAIIHQFDIDGTSSVTAYKCLNCNTKLEDGICSNAQCLSAIGLQQSTEVCFDIRITLTDHTGSLPNCHISDTAAQNLLKCKATEYVNLSPDLKTQIKWKYLLKPCIAKMLILPCNDLKNPLFTVVSMELVSLTEYSSNLPMH